MPFVANKVTVTDKVLEILSKISNSRTLPKDQVERAKIVVMSAAGIKNAKIAKEIGVSRDIVSRWRNRWIKTEEFLNTIEREKPEELEENIVYFLKDKERSGTPPKFTAEQVIKILQLACQNPTDYGYEISHWSLPKLADVAVKEKIVESIAPSSVDRFLKDGEIQPHRIRYWLHSSEKYDDPETYAKKVNEICETYEKAIEVHEEGGHTISVDEMTGIQAIERKYPDKPVTEGKPVYREHEYIRHGTTTLIAFYDIATGKSIAPYLNKTRNETDFRDSVLDVIRTDITAPWTFVCDLLNTHQSESLVRMVADLCDITIDLGVKGKSGILKNMKTRREFLTNKDHRIRFVYTPKHSSWLNQVEIWFSILSRKLLKRKSYCSVEELQQSILRFIEQYNSTAKPFRWTYKGVPLAA